MFRSMNWEKEIMDAYVAGQQNVKIQPGVYYLPKKEGAHFYIANVICPDHAPLTVDMTGVVMVCEDNDTRAIFIENCKNLTIEGAEVGYHVPMMTQGEITAILNDGKTIEVELDEGYPSLEKSQDKTSYVFYRNTRKMKNDTPDLYALGAEYAGGAKWHVNYAYDVRECNVAVKDILGFRCEGAMAIVVDGSEKVTLRCLTVTDGCFAILETGGEGANVYDRITVKVKEKPKGAVHGRVLSTYADSFHSASVCKGPTITGCRFEAMGDDCVNIHGSYGYFAGKDEIGAFLYATEGRNVFDRVGERIRMLDKMGNILHETTITQVLGEAVDYHLHQNAFTDSNKRFQAKKYFRVTLAADFEAEIGMRMANLDRGGSGFKLLNNFFGPNRARGALIKADDGLVEGNFFSGQSIHALLISPEYFWNESCFVNNLTIRNNIFDNAGFCTNYRPAIVIEGEFGEKGGISHRNITIEQNIFRNNNLESLLIQHARMVNVCGNIFGARNGIAKETRVCTGHVRVQNARDVRFENNIHSGDMPFVFDNGNAEFVEE